MTKLGIIKNKHEKCIEVILLIVCLILEKNVFLLCHNTLH